MKERTTDNFSSFLNGFNPDTDSLAKLALEDMIKSGLSSKTLDKGKVNMFSGDSNLLKDLLGGFSSVNGNQLLKV